MDEPGPRHAPAQAFAAASGLALLALLALLLVPAAHAADAPLVLHGDPALAAAAHSGAGTAENPYRIRGLVVSAAQGHGIQVSGTRAHLVLDGVAVSSGGGSWDGIRLVDVRNVTIVDSTLEGDRTGIHVSDSQDVRIERTTVKTSRVGVALERSSGVVLSDNRLSVNDKDVSLRDSRDNRFLRNNLTTATGQYGFFFEDAQSYRNEIGTSNVVNFLPVHWYVDPCPARIEGVFSELKGATNVAQVMLHGCRGTLVDGVRAKDGALAGIHLIDASNVTVSRLTVEGNAGPGVHVQGGADVRLDNGTVRANGLGLRVEDHPRGRVADLAVESNAGDGLLAARSPDLSLRRSTVLHNGGRGVAFEHSPRGLVADAEVSSNRAAGVSLVDSPNATLSRNRVVDNAQAGILLLRSQAWGEGNVLRGQPRQVQFSATRDSDLRQTEIVLAQGQIGFHFDDVASYANSLGPTNLVNGVPLRWYHDVAGTPASPLRLGDFNASVPGATNVAQVMIHQSRHVLVQNVVASDGVAHGLVVHGSSSVTVSNATAERNARTGVRVELSSDVRVQESNAAENREDGFLLLGSPAGTLESSRSRGNLARGAALEASPLGTVRGLLASANRGAGIQVARSTGEPALVENNVVRSNLGGGILLHDSLVGVLRGNVVRDNGPDGIHFLSVREGAVVVENEVRNHTREVRFSATQGLDLQRNRLHLSVGGHGLFFDDETSWNHSIPTSNTVEGVPVRWYNGVVRAASSPLVLDDVRVELPGITNVAQVLLRKMENVTLQSPLAANGTHRGLVVVDSSNVTLQAARVENNTQDGLQVRGSKDVLAQAPRARENRGHGVLLQQSERVRLDGAVLTENAGRGLHAESVGLVLDRPVAQGNRDAGIVVVGEHPDGVSVANGTVRLNRAGGLRFENARLTHLRDTLVEENVGVGALLVGGRFANVDGSRWANNTVGGLRIESSQPGVVARNAFHDNGDFGLLLVSEPPGGAASENVAVNHTKGVGLVNTRAWEFHGNRVHLARDGQTGFHFADETSYENALGTTNAVNGTALRWYSGVDAPQTLEGVRVEVRGITNVAQVALVNARNVAFVAPVVANGTGHGFLLHRSVNVSVLGGLVENNSKDGVRAFEGSAHLVRNATLRGNGGDGLALLNAGGSTLAGSVVERNGGVGARLHGRTSGNEVFETGFRANAKGGVETEDAIAPRLLRNALHDNGPKGIHLARTSGIARVEDNVLSNHSAGVRLAATEYAEVHRNRLSILPGQTGFHFDDETSYNNVMPPTNEVDGTPLRWYVGLTGTESSPIVLGGVRVELRGITNVAQVMLHRSSYVTLEGVKANNGTARGIELYHSSSIILVDAVAVGNEDGIQLKSTQSSQLRAPDVQGNKRGVKLVASNNNALTDVHAAGTEIGVLVADGDSRGNRIQGAEASRARVASVQDPSANGLRGNNLVADAGLDRRVRVERALRFDGGLATYRFETERITLQRWEYGDGASDESREPTPFRPLHNYSVAGQYRANLTVQTADGRTLRDSLWVTVVPPLSEPRNLRALEGDRNVTLVWDPPLHDGASLVTGHRIHRGPSPDNLTLLAETGAETFFLDAKELVNGRAYHYAVTAVNADGEGPRSASVAARPGAPPSAPLDLAAKPGSGNVTLTWRPPAEDNGRPVTAYRILRGPTARDLFPFAEVGNVTSWTDRNVGNGIPYHYAVAAVNAKGEGVRSAPVSGTPTPLPSPPQGLHALPGERSIALVWDQQVRPGDAAVLKYRVLRGEGPDNLTLLAETDAREHRDATALQGVLHHYAVVAVNDAGESERSAVVTAMLQERDTLKPIFLFLAPEAGLVHAQPPTEVLAEFLDNLGVVPSTVRLVVDGIDVTASSDVTARRARHAPAEPFAPGTHTVEVSAADAAGNVAHASWTFRVVDPSALAARWEHSGLNATSLNVTLGESILVQSVVRNVGGAAGTLEARLLADNDTYATELVTLEPGEEKTVSFRYRPTLAGLVNLTVGDQPPLLVTVLGPDDALPVPEGVPEGAMPLATDEEGEEPAEEKRGFLKFLPDTGPFGPLLALGLAGLAFRRRR